MTIGKSVNYSIPFSKKEISVINRARRIHKMSFNEYSCYAVKVLFRADYDNDVKRIRLEAPGLLFTTKEARAWRRTNR
jgi:hypothetical protein